MVGLLSVECYTQASKVLLAQIVKSSKHKKADAATKDVGTEEYPRFSVSPMMVSFALGCFIALFIPYYTSGFWPATQDALAGAAFAPQALFLGLTSFVCLFVGMAGRVPNEEKIPRPPVEIFLAIFLGWYAISLLTAQYKHDAILETARAGGVLCWFFLIREWFKKLPPEKFATYLLLFLGCITVGTLPSVIPALVDYVQTHNPRQFGSFYNPNLFANFCAMAVPLMLGAALYSRQMVGNFARAGKVLFWLFSASALLTFGALIVTSSKGGFLAIVVAALVFAVAILKTRENSQAKVSPDHKIATWIASTLFFVAIVALLSFTLGPRIATSLHDDHSSMFRWYTWIGTFKMAKAKPIFGWGPGAFANFFSIFAITGYTRSAHQSWLQLAAENGWPAMVILLIACGAAWRGGWAALKTSRYPLAAGALAALTAFFVHGMVDSGWGVISVSWLLVATLAILAILEITPEIPRPVAKATSLNWPWLAVAVILGGLALSTQHTSMGEDLRAQSAEEASKAEKSAVDTAQEAIRNDPGSVRLWANLARVRWSLGEDAEEAYRKAISLQPKRAAGYYDLARYLQETNPQKNEDEIGELYDEALNYDRHDTQLRMARAKWYLEHDDRRGWDDLRYILDLQEKPFGRYPAVPEIVDFHYGQAALMLARHDLDDEKISSTEELLQIAAEEIQKARNYVDSDYQQQILESAGKSNSENREKLAQMKSDYQELSEQLQFLEKRLQAEEKAKEKIENKE